VTVTQRYTRKALTYKADQIDDLFDADVKEDINSYNIIARRHRMQPVLDSINSRLHEHVTVQPLVLPVI
jgi:hypothetical protein